MQIKNETASESPESFTSYVDGNGTGCETHTVVRVEILEDNASDLQREFHTAEPFPHLVVDDFLRLSSESAAAFPGISWPWWSQWDDGYIRNKRFCAEIDLIPEPFKAVIRELNEPRFLSVLEKVTGIRQLLPDPYLFGGGIQLSGAGGILTPHTDFHYLRALNLYRRINVIVYLNESWSLNDGGCLSLYDAEGQAVQTVVPVWGRALIFRTDDQSVHGFPLPVAEGSWRQSLALFYYTAAPADSFGGDETTYYREHGEQHGIARKARLLAYSTLLNLSRNVSMLAYVVNPNLGFPAVKAHFAYVRKAKAREIARKLLH
ncbi:2OG-Fe(II) oxygenase [Mycobacteroides franklinii]|uniref:2OG-Fe(II) oxygenase n=1 Tax=Mycobacteroides franklinii TaxID=948102 RepID=UPI000991BD96|nr:2OG-Fe(II) oxygenase [Mycobacteroides franklinii]